MNKFVNSIGDQMTTTENGMPARKSTANECLDLFFKIGAMRKSTYEQVVAVFSRAFAEDRETALRIAAWARDVRGGAGERSVFRHIVKYLETVDFDAALRLLSKVPDIGRWDDLLVAESNDGRAVAYFMIDAALKHGDGLAAKWMPRKGEDAARLRKALGMTPKQYRKTLVGLTNVVEQKMCAKEWDSIDFEKLPSVASSRYRTAFYRNAEAKYKAYAEALTKGTAKINAGAVYPYDVLNGINVGGAANAQVINAQWNALPNFMGDQKVLAMVDTSGSMGVRVSPTSTVMAIDVAISLGLYVADKAKSAFKDVFLTFSAKPVIQQLKGKGIVEKYNQMYSANWDMNTDLMAAFDQILVHAQNFKVPAEDMPSTLLILSDMQFDQCMRTPPDTAMKGIARRYEAAGYEMPQVVFWNIMARDNVPVKFNQIGVAMVSGFSPAILKSILSDKLESFTPMSVMHEAISDPRYA